MCYTDRPNLPSFPTRRSSDLVIDPTAGILVISAAGAAAGAIMITAFRETVLAGPLIAIAMRDRKSTRLNSSHANTSYAVCCLKKERDLLWVIRMMVLWPGDAQ